MQLAEFEVQELFGRYHHQIKFPASKPDEPHPSLVILHRPKDRDTILSVWLKNDAFKENAVGPSFWTSLDRDVLKGFPNLEAALAYLGSIK